MAWIQKRYLGVIIEVCEVEAPVTLS